MRVGARLMWMIFEWVDGVGWSSGLAGWRWGPGCMISCYGFDERIRKARGTKDHGRSWRDAGE